MSSVVRTPKSRSQCLEEAPDQEVFLGLNPPFDRSYIQIVPNTITRIAGGIATSQFKGMQHFVCGPGSMMDAMEETLPKIGIPTELIHAERFNMV